MQEISDLRDLINEPRQQYQLLKDTLPENVPFTGCCSIPGFDQSHTPPGNMRLSLVISSGVNATCTRTRGTLAVLVAETPHCYRHPGRETLVSCSECGRPICEECMTFAPVGIRCPDHSGQPQGAARMTQGARRASFPRDLSEATGGRLFAIESTTDLSATFSKILEEFRMRYLVSYSPQGVAPAGWHRLDVRVKNRNVTVKARPGYFAGQG